MTDVTYDLNKVGWMGSQLALDAELNWTELKSDELNNEFGWISRNLIRVHWQSTNPIEECGTTKQGWDQRGIFCCYLAAIYISSSGFFMMLLDSTAIHYLRLFGFSTSDPPPISPVDFICNIISDCLIFLGVLETRLKRDNGFSEVLWTLEFLRVWKDVVTVLYQLGFLRIAKRVSNIPRNCSG